MRKIGWVRVGKSCCMLSFSTFCLTKERMEENKGWQLCCQVILNSLIRTSPVQILDVSHNMVVDLPLEGLPVVLWREHRAGERIPFPECLRYERSQRYQCVHDKGALQKGSKRSHLKSIFFLLILSFYTENLRFCCCIRTVFFLINTWNRILFFVEQ